MLAGFGNKPNFSYDSPDNDLANYFRHNLFSFSAAKSLTEVKAFNALLLDTTGNPKSEAQFRNDVADTGALFNKTWLATEAQTALASVQGAQTWNTFQPDDLLQVSTAGDDRVRPTHAANDGFTAPKSDPIWLRFWIPFDHGCRCNIIPGLAKNVKEYNADDMIQTAGIKPLFQRNCGIDKVVYTNDHTYYQDSFGNETELKAEANYGMPSPKKLYTDFDFPAPKQLAAKHDVTDWWQSIGGNQSHADITDNRKNTVRITTETRNRLPFNLIGNIDDIVTNPDEIWSYMNNGKLETIYLKYYENHPISVHCTDSDITAINALENSNGSYNEAAIRQVRKGILQFRKV